MACPSLVHFATLHSLIRVGLFTASPRSKAFPFLLWAFRYYPSRNNCDCKITKNNNTKRDFHRKSLLFIVNHQNKRINLIPVIDYRNYLAGFLGLIIIIILLPSSLGSWSTLPTCSSS